MLNNIVGFFTNFTVSLTFFLHCGFWYLGALACTLSRSLCLTITDLLPNSVSFLAVYWVRAF